jgi:purine-nucleoside/S-methyl-5'-thioadenosine phosphorylase / adenosine deaminase
MIIIRSQILDQFSNITFGFSTKIGLDRKPPFNFNMSHSVGDDEKLVEQNREAFAKMLGLKSENIAYQKQVHGESIQIVNKGGKNGDSDAMITNKPGIGLAISSADCCAIFIYDPVNKVIGAVHSGWRSTEKKILLKTIKLMHKKFGSSYKDLHCYIAPSISQINYEVGEEVAKLFKKKYLKRSNEKYLLDVAGANRGMLIKKGIPRKQIQCSSLCSFEQEKLLHSYRREGQQSGRAFGVIAIMENN